MKIKILYIIIISIIIFPFNIMSQNNKIGYANIKFIFRFLPEVQDMNLSIKNLEHKFKNTLKENLTKFQIKLNYYQREYNNMSEKVKTNKENELEKLRDKIQKLQIESQTSIIAKQLELSQPIYDKIQKSIEEIAIKENYTHIFNTHLDIPGSGNIPILLYAEKNNDISKLILKKLKVNININN